MPVLVAGYCLFCIDLMKGDDVQGTAGHHVGGGDRTVPMHVPYSPPRPKPRGLDWSALNAEPSPAQETTMPNTDLRECTNCGDEVAYLSSRLWCDSCESGADDIPAVVSAPVEMPDDGADELEHDVIAQAASTLVLPDYALQLAGLLADTEGHPDPLVRATRKIVTQAAVALLQAVKASHSSDPDAKTTAPVLRPGTQSSVAAPSGSEPTAAEYRSWALKNGHSVNTTGRVPGYIKDLYAAAHQDVV